jgi:putative phosphoribosyl transferase
MSARTSPNSGGLESTFGNEQMRFTDRRDAGRRLAERLTQYAGRNDVVVLALPEANGGRHSAGDALRAS